MIVARSARKGAPNETFMFTNSVALLRTVNIALMLDTLYGLELRDSHKY